MRRAFLALAFAGTLGLSSCGSFSRETVTLSPVQVAEVAQAAGVSANELAKKSAEELRAAAEQALSVAVERVTVAADSVKVELPALAKEALAAGGTSALDTIARNPTPSSVGAAGVAAAAAIFALWARRSRLRREAKQNG